MPTPKAVCRKHCHSLSSGGIGCQARPQGRTHSCDDPPAPPDGSRPHSTTRTDWISPSEPERFTDAARLPATGDSVFSWGCDARRGTTSSAYVGRRRGVDGHVTACGQPDSLGSARFGDGRWHAVKRRMHWHNNTTPSVVLFTATFAPRVHLRSSVSSCWLLRAIGRKHAQLYLATLPCLSQHSQNGAKDGLCATSC